MFQMNASLEGIAWEFHKIPDNKPVVKSETIKKKLLV